VAKASKEGKIALKNCITISPTNFANLHEPIIKSSLHAIAFQNFNNSYPIIKLKKPNLGYDHSIIISASKIKLEVPVLFGFLA
jgi:hypothetical protein